MPWYKNVSSEEWLAQKKRMARWGGTMPPTMTAEQWADERRRQGPLSEDEARRRRLAMKQYLNR